MSVLRLKWFHTLAIGIILRMFVTIYICHPSFIKLWFDTWGVITVNSKKKSCISYLNAYQKSLISNKSKIYSNTGLISLIIRILLIYYGLFRCYIYLHWTYLDKRVSCATTTLYDTIMNWWYVRIQEIHKSMSGSTIIEEGPTQEKARLY